MCAPLGHPQVAAAFVKAADAEEPRERRGGYWRYHRYRPPANCPNCGAPHEPTPTCSYCQAERTDP